jgi:hypothetical protein
MPVALATLAGVCLLIGSVIALSSVSGDGDAEILRAAHENSSSVTLSGVMQALGFVLLAAPLVYLFRAVQVRTDLVRGQLIGVVIAAPLFLAGASLLNAVSTNDAASEFVAGETSTDLTLTEATRDCREERSDDPDAFTDEFGGVETVKVALVRCAKQAIADDKASNAISDAPTTDVATGLGLGGRLGLAFAFVYTCLWAMRTGLLTRFWGSLGMALGVAALLLLIQFTLIWFVYFGLLAAGWVPGGRPPAWAAGKAIPWPTPGEQAAAELEPEDDEPTVAAMDGDDPAPRADGPRKRKQRG